MISVNEIDYTWFKVYLSFIIICLVAAFFYLLYLYVAICRSKPMRAYRHNVFMYISLFYIIVILVVTLLGSLYVFNFSGGLIFFAFAFNNCYSYFLMYLYTPTKDQLVRYSEGDYETGSSQAE